MLQEFEIWTTGDHPRNVALATNGGKALGKARHAIDESLGDTDLLHEEDDDPLFVAHNICCAALAKARGGK